MKLFPIIGAAALLLTGCIAPPDDAIRSSWKTNGNRYDTNSLESDLDDSLDDLEDAMLEDSERN